MPDIQFRQKNIDPKITQYRDTELSLDIFLQGNNFSFGISNTESRKLLAFVNYPLPSPEIPYAEAIDTIFKKEALLRDFEYGIVRYSSNDYKWTIVPKTLFQEEGMETYIGMLYPQEELDIISYDYVFDLDAYIVSSHGSAYKNMIIDKFPYAFYIPLSVKQYEHFSDIAKHGSKKQKHEIFLHKRKACFDLWIFDNNNLIFANTFTARNQDDILYYFLYASNKLMIDLGSAKLNLCGDCEKENIFELLENYTHKIDYLQALSKSDFGKKFSYTSQYFYVIR